MKTKTPEKFYEEWQPKDPEKFDSRNHPMFRFAKDYSDYVQEQMAKVVSVSLPSVDDAGVIAVKISEINNEMTAKEQAFFIAGFQECVKYLEMMKTQRTESVCDRCGNYSLDSNIECEHCKEQMTVDADTHDIELLNKIIGTIGGVELLALNETEKDKIRLAMIEYSIICVSVEKQLHRYEQPKKGEQK